MNSQRGATADSGAATGSAGTAPVGGTALGGSVGNRSQSKLLQSKPRNPEVSMDEDELLNGNDSGEPESPRN